MRLVGDMSALENPAPSPLHAPPSASQQSWHVVDSQYVFVKGALETTCLAHRRHLTKLTLLILEKEVMGHLEVRV